MYTKKAMNDPYEGQDFSEQELQTVPDQDMSLAEMIDRFTRNEALPEGFPVQYFEGEDDLEKLQHMDMVDKQDYIRKMQVVLDQYDEEQKIAREILLEEEQRKYAENLKKQWSEENSAESKVNP